MSTSAIDTKCEHSHSIVQTPHRCGRQRPFSGSRRPRVHEPGASVANHARPSVVAIPREQPLYPNPLPSSTSCHNRVSAKGWSAHNEDAPSSEPIHTAAWVVLSTRLGHASRPLPRRKETFNRARGAFHQCADPRKDELAIPPRTETGTRKNVEAAPCRSPRFLSP